MPRKESLTDFAVDVLCERWSKLACLDYVRELSWAPSGYYLACADASGHVSVHSAVTGHVNELWSAHKLSALRVRWSHDGQYIASSGQDGRVNVYESASCTKLFTIDYGNVWVEHIAWNRQKNCLLSAAGKQMRLTGPDGDLIQQFDDHNSTISDIIWHPQLPGTFASSCYGGVRTWGESDGSPKRCFDWKGSLMNIAYSPNGKVIAAGCLDGAVQVWMLPSGDALFMNGYQTKVRELSWDCSSRYLASGGGEQVIVWDFSGRGPAGSKPQMFSGHHSFISVLAFSPTGAKLASGGLDGVVIVRDLNDKQRTFRAEGDSAVSTLAWSPSGSQLAVGFASGRITVFDEI